SRRLMARRLRSLAAGLIWRSDQDLLPIVFPGLVCDVSIEGHLMATQRPFSRRVRHWFAAFALAGLVGSVLAAAPVVPTTAAADDPLKPAPPEPGTDVPQSDIKFGMRPYADNTFYIVAMKKGWFKDVGVNIVPPPYGLKVTDTNVVALLLNGQLDISSE